MSELDQAVIDLHNIARLVEEAFGQPGSLSIDIRRCGDRLANILKPTDESKKGEY